MNNDKLTRAGFDNKCYKTSKRKSRQKKIKNLGPKKITENNKNKFTIPTKHL